MTATPKPDQWRQISGDMDPATYGAVIARYHGEAIELLEILPVREYLSDQSTVAVGFPFWSREAYYYPADLDPSRDDVQSALRYCGFDADAWDEEHRAMGIAECLLRYGVDANEGRDGFAKDVLGDRRVLWWGTKRPRGWRHLESEDQEFRQLQKDYK